MGFFGNSKKDMSGVKFRGIEWGASKEEVLENEDSEPVSTQIEGDLEVVQFKDMLQDTDFFVNYYIIDDKLAKGIYICNGHIIQDEAINLFEDLDEMLQDKYGKPSTKNTASNEAQLAQAGGYGASQWDGEDIAVELSLMYQQGGLTLQILYEKKDLNQELVEKLKESTAEKL